MQASEWAPEHCKALQDYLALGMSFAEIAREINARFGTAYSRNAAISRSKRMKLTAPRRPLGLPKARPRTGAELAAKSRENHRAEVARPVAAPPPGRPEPVRLRCVGISPRLVPLVELDASDCRYPYGGDRENEPITFCGHPRLAGSSYCAPHFHLTRGPGTEAERDVAPVALRLVRAA
ncbi:GcrA family cell cycle regulator [Bradyrhizobium sp. Tv2a-2]|uniref:GcrA family cell cycle regulator n=1 Tax=Bradyrhizobium sp. Tv2a-2 TaxID=113395 RepID=UPI0004046942|nr:GcrA family cell cycle regulator [Bradyrhizobium sp. Tv2a-2]